MLEALAILAASLKVAQLVQDTIARATAENRDVTPEELAAIKQTDTDARQEWNDLLPKTPAA